MTSGGLKSFLADWFDPRDPEALELRRDQLSIAASVARGGPLPMLFIVGCIAAIALEWHGIALVGGWVVGATTAICLSDIVLRRVKARLKTGASYRALNAAYVASSALIVTSLALAGPLFWIQDNVSSHLFLLLLLMIGPSLAVAQQASHPPTAAMASIYLLTALALCLHQGEMAYTLLAVVCLILLAMLASVVVRTSRTTVAMLTLRNSEHRLLEQQKDLMAQQDELVAQLRDANQSKADFLARMSHELRTPLNAVIGFSDVMRQESLGPIGTPAYLDYLGHIHSSGSHLLGLINDILDLSKMEAGRFELREGLVDLWEVVHDATSMVKLRAAEGEVTLVNEVPQGIELTADETAVRQIAINVVTNAIKFTPPGGQVRWSVGHDLDGALLLKITDTGVGIAASDMERVFEAFGQARNGYSAKERGTGLGLPIVRTLMRLHGGEALLDSVPGEGTTVTLRFPSGRIRSNGRKAAA
ncbi:Sensor histidine kinase RcsC [Alphaproteobacteria bacterium SO-S41]|nr:Sensor histidine kinase RcsC [Alphaproteobacteria bacterium SO-S41]